MTTPADVGISDIDIQNYFDDDLNSQILGFFAHGQAFKWHYRTRPNNGEGFYTGLFGISIWQLLGMNNNSPFQPVLNLFTSSC